MPEMKFDYDLMELADSEARMKYWTDIQVVEGPGLDAVRQIVLAQHREHEMAAAAPDNTDPRIPGAVNEAHPCVKRVVFPTGVRVRGIIMSMGGGKTEQNRRFILHEENKGKSFLFVLCGVSHSHVMMHQA